MGGFNFNFGYAVLAVIAHIVHTASDVMRGLELLKKLTLKVYFNSIPIVI